VKPPSLEALFLTFFERHHLLRSIALKHFVGASISLNPSFPLGVSGVSLLSLTSYHSLTTPLPPVGVAQSELGAPRRLFPFLFPYLTWISFLAWHPPHIQGLAACQHLINQKTFYHLPVLLILPLSFPRQPVSYFFPASR